MMKRSGVGFKMRRFGWPLALPCLYLMALNPGPAFASAAAQKDAYTRCVETGAAARGEYPAMMDCVHDEIGRRDDELNALYQSLRRRLPPARMRQLRIEERAWIKARDVGCRKKSARESAGDEPPDDRDTSQDRMMFWSFCVLDETNNRITQLSRIR